MVEYKYGTYHDTTSDRGFNLRNRVRPIEYIECMSQAAIDANMAAVYVL